jgi:hypothetical protein
MANLAKHVATWMVYGNSIYIQVYYCILMVRLTTNYSIYTYIIKLIIHDENSKEMNV